MTETVSERMCYRCFKFHKHSEVVEVDEGTTNNWLCLNCKEKYGYEKDKNGKKI